MPNSQQKRSWWRCIIEFEQGAMTKSDWRRQKTFILLCASWALSYVAANWLLKGEQVLAFWQLVLTLTIPVIIGAAAVLSYIHFLRKADELVQKVHYEGIAVGFGLGILYNVAYQLMVNAGIDTIDYSITVMAIGWALGVLRASWRFQ